MKRLLAVVLFAAGAAWAQTSVIPPQSGFLRDSSNSLRPVYGTAGSFVLGNTVAGSVISAAYSGSYGLVKTGSAVSVIDQTGSLLATEPASDGPALFAFKPTGEPSLVYIQAAKALLAWNGQAFEVVPLDFSMLSASAVLSIATPRFGPAKMIIQRDDGLWELRIRIATGEIVGQTAIPGISAPVLMLASEELIYAGANDIVLRSASGSETHVRASLPASFEFEQMGQAWIQVRDLTLGQQFAVRITPNREQFYQLPEVGQ
jgi:hypothetical protein